MMDAIEAGRELRRRVASLRSPRLRSRIRFNLPMNQNELNSLLDANRHNALSAMIRIQTTPTVSEEEMIAMFTQIGRRLPKLVNMEVTCSYRPQPIPIRALDQCLIQLEDRLESLRLGAYLTGTQADYEAAFRHVAQLKNLKTIALSAFGAHITDETEGWDSRQMTRWVVDSLLRSIKNVGSLEFVRFCMSQPSMAAGSALERLCQATPTTASISSGPKRKKLDVSMYGVAVSEHLIRVMCGENSMVRSLRMSDVRNTMNEMAPGIAEGFRNNKSIRELSLRGADVSIQTWTMLLAALQASNSLRTLRLDANEITMPMYQAMNQMTHLRRLDLSVLPRFRVHATNSMGHIFDDLCNSLIGNLGRNKSLKHLKVHLHGYISLVNANRNNEPTDAMRQTCRNKMNERLEEALKTNHCLREVRIVVSGRSLPLSDMATFLLQFNEAGRKELVERPDDRERWVDMIVDESYNTPLIYHLISENPGRLLPCVANCDIVECRRKRLRDFLLEVDVDFLQRSKRRRLRL